ncbi:MAG: DUF2079 domain-containing protein [Oscillospiraceae bacterium]|nr:DUF2079 domain-containing protein [Oscillospiraceae bacterium]
MTLLKRKRKTLFPAMIRHLVFGWLLAVTLEFLLLRMDSRVLSGLESLTRMSFLRVLAVTALGFGGMTLLSRFHNLKKAETWAIVILFLVLSASAVYSNNTLPFLIACGLIGVILAAYGCFGWDSSPECAEEPVKAKKRWVWITAALAAAFFAAVSAWTVCRVTTFSTPTYDFGIFAQMFHNMKESGLPMTTVERDGLLSHFAVHVSPIYYLMLPFYCLFPTPATLQVLQAAVLASSVIPLWLIGKQHGLSGPQRTLACALLLLLPAFAGGTSYDIHENCFLAPLILWLFYGIDRKNTLITAIAGLLTLLVKEDAAVYVAVIALWFIVRTLLHLREEGWKPLITGIGLFTGAIVWFFLVTGYLAQSGDGVMTYRYDNFIYDGSSSLFTVIKAVLMNPMKAVFECVDPEKLVFLGQTLIPLLGLPLLTRRYERYILLIPYVLVNLMSDYTYQHDIFFQYTFGSTACLIYLTVVNLADLKLDWHRLSALGAAVAIAAVFFTQTVVPKITYYTETALRYSAYYQSVRDTLDTVPKDASVSATTFYTTYLSQREVLYDVRYAQKDHVLSTEYVVLNVNGASEYKRYATGGQNNGYENLTRLLEANGYEIYESLGEIIVIYRKEQ